MAVVGALPGRRARARLENGLEVRVLERPDSGLVSTVLWYHVGTRDERAAEGGVAHFLEHMMFKGSARYEAGAIDRITQFMGGDNNAFTSHDATVYTFRFAPRHWHEALAIEADRMAGLALESNDLEKERQVILEEISMYDNEPWEALERDVLAALYGNHAYGRPILGSRDEVSRLSSVDLQRFHQRFYHPSNTLLAVAGEVSLDEVLEAASPLERLAGVSGSVRKEGAEPSHPTDLVRLERRRGEVDRMLLAMPAGPANGERHALLRLLAALLTLGRSSRLHRRMVEELQWCLWISAEVAELATGGHWTIALEVLPGVEPSRVEQELLLQLGRLRLEPPVAEEIERAQRILSADWLFAHERVHHQALALGAEEALWGPGWNERQMTRIAAATPRELAELVQDLDPQGGGVLGWSLKAA